jgi:hypothetical protein
MGSSSSHPIVVSPTSTEKNYVPMTLNKYDDLPTLLSNSTAPSPEVSLFNMKRWEAAFNGDDKSKLASNLISKLDFTTALCDRKVAANNKQCTFYSDTIRVVIGDAGGGSRGTDLSFPTSYSFQHATFSSDD